MPHVYCVRADFATYTDHFLKGGPKPKGSGRVLLVYPR
jgi:hypothetical protein